MPPRIPTPADFSHLPPSLHVSLHFPSPPESTTAFLILFHGLGDHEEPFASFARNLSLPGVMAISVRGTSVLPQSLLDDEPPASAAAASSSHYHWGDDVTFDPSTGEIDPDPGFRKAIRAVMGDLVRGTLLEKCGWEMSDIILFGFGQGGSLALGLASQLAAQDTVIDVSEGVQQKEEGKTFKGVVSIGGGPPSSTVSTRSARQQSSTHVLTCQLDDESVNAVKKEFRDVTVVRWKRKDVAMPRDRDEVFPIMKFFADRLKSGW